MNRKQLYSSGQASEICSVSKRALRLYESKGLITPDHISDSGYRYFTMETLRRVQVIRYFLEEGFSLEVAGELLATNSLDDYEQIFHGQIEKTKQQINYYQNRLDSLKGWYALLCEGNRIKMLGKDNFSLKHIPTAKYMYMEGELDMEDPYSEAKLETRHYTMAKSDGHSMIDVGGAYTLYFSDYNDRICLVSTEVTLFQESYPNSQSHENIRELSGFLAVSAYHLGPLDKIQDTYKRGLQWAADHGIKLTGESFERYVIDIYTSDNAEDFITEILFPVDCANDDFNYLSNI